jgi:hypothetical protein
VSYEGNFKAKRTVMPQEMLGLGIDLEEVIGSEDDYNSKDSYKEVAEDVGQNGITINDVTIRPDGTVFIGTDNGIAVEGEAAKRIFEYAFENKNDAAEEAATTKTTAEEQPEVQPEV